MSLNHPSFISFNGEPLTGRTPPQMRMEGVLTQQQYAGVVHAYKLFCDMTSIALGDYQVSNRVLTDGTKIRMVSINKTDTVYVWPTGGTKKEQWFRGLCAYPAMYASVNSMVKTGWSPTVVFRAVTVAPTPMVVSKKNPKQARAPVTYPKHEVIRVQYWVTTGGNVWTNYNSKHLSLAKKGFGDDALRVDIVSVPTVIRNPALTPPSYDLPAASYGPIPFFAKFDGFPDAKYLVTSHAVADSSGKIVIEFTPRTAVVPAIRPEDVIPARNPTQLPPAISTPGTALALQAYDAVYFRENPYGYSTRKKKYWWLMTSVASGGLSSGAIVESDVTALSYFSDTTSSVNSGAYLPIDDTMEPMDWHFVYPRNNEWGLNQVMGYNWNSMLNHLLGDYGDVISSERHETTYTDPQKDFFDFPLTVAKNSSTVIGYVPRGIDLEAVTVKVVSTINRKLHAQGQFYYGTPDITAGHAGTPQIGGLAYGRYARVGEGSKRYVRTKIEVDETNISYIEVAVGADKLKTFEVNSSTTGRALKRTIIRTAVNTSNNWDGMSGRVSADVYVQVIRLPGWDAPGTRTSPDPLFGIEYAVSGVVMEPGYQAFYDNAAATWPTVWDAFHHLIDDVENEAEDTDYVTDMAMDIAARTILACDLQIGFMAYLELKVVNNIKATATKAHDWVYDLRGLEVPAEEFDNTVTGKFIITLNGTTYTKELFEVVVSKPLVCTRNITTNWHQWDGGDTFYDGQQDLLSSRIWLPTTTAFTGIDGVFQHQGVCQDLAGFTKDEVEDLAKAKYPVGTDLHKVIYSKRFNIGAMADSPIWLMTYTEIDSIKEEAKGKLDAPPEWIVPYYYSPELKEKLLDTVYNVEFGPNGLRAWIDDIPVDTATPPYRDAVCFRI